MSNFFTIMGRGLPGAASQRHLRRTRESADTPPVRVRFGAPGGAVKRVTRTLRVSFESAEAFQREYAANLVHGGVFIPTEHAVELRERVDVELVLAFSGDRLTLAGEVVHSVAPEMAKMGATPGVAVQFDDAGETVGKRLAKLCARTGPPVHQPVDSGRRRAPRTKARVSAKIDAEAGRLAGHTRDLSRSGVLVSVPGEGVPVGERVRLSLTHPTSGESMQVDGLVVRDIRSDGAVSGLGVAFEPAENERADLERFVDGIQSTEHTRRLGGITGEVAEVGIQNLVQMFLGSIPTGTLTLQRGEREGVIGFEDGMLCFARLGAASGLKALVRLLTWSEGRFEFHASLDPVEERNEPVRLEAALFDAARLLDEGGRIDRSRLSADVRPRLGKTDTQGDDLSKLELTLLELVRAGFTVQRMVDLIPEPDPEIYRALVSLSESGAISV
jgi:Tfp pilus assembly protein PilZ